jgi:hypothetical protein
MTDYTAGDCPADEPIDLVPEELYLKRASERGRHVVVLGSIRGHLEEQPTPLAVLSAVRQWINEVIAVGDEVAKTKRNNSG